MMRHLFSFVAVLTIAFATAATAGSSRAGDPVLPAAEVAQFADRVQQDLAARGARVAIVARVGRDPSQLPAGVTYTHVAFWVFTNITLPDGRTGTGYRAYNLYQRAGDGGRSDLVQDSAQDFFVGAVKLDAGIVIPDPRLQDQLLATIASPTYARLHNPAYSVMANPMNGARQNCTEHTLDVLVASICGTSDAARIKANIAAYFTPQTIPLDGLKRGIAGLATPALSTADHGPVIRTATFGSIARFMTQHRLAQSVHRITPNAVTRF